MTDLAGRLGPDRVRLGVCCTLWWNDDFPTIDAGIPFGQAVSEMALAGFQGCSIGHKYPSDPAELKAALDLRGLRVSEPWTSTYFTIGKMYQKTVDSFEQTLATIKALGGDELVVAEFGASSHLLPVDVFANRPVFSNAQWDALTAGLDTLGKIANSAGMKLSYHHHMGTGVMTRDDIDRLMASTDPDLVFLLLDTGHAAFAGDDPLELARAYAHRIGHVHMKSVRPEVVSQVREQGLSFQQGVELGVFTVPGDGAIDFRPIFEVLADADYRGWLVVEAEQDPNKANPLAYAMKARAYLADVLGW
ncbi:MULTISPECIES: myo-inosose-2 dehydratase [Actinoplanes]|uniref:Myo-inosose-2 dehydratase n=2 Tax=Actinoplanes TaxID=1865 RepID=A0A117MQ03_9ACTN|nr:MULTISPECIES: myo-inosose-2 dehydratase [Actinoplanes]KUL29424.1 myo-inosose-2 dehydratase [Actinoplanes awajinensis subsp. mycoplanecinus]GIE70579.1 myo-inosose-2 dehydratase [Actinoplanes palleronii]